MVLSPLLQLKRITINFVGEWEMVYKHMAAFPKDSSRYALVVLCGENELYKKHRLLPKCEIDSYTQL